MGIEESFVFDCFGVVEEFWVVVGHDMNIIFKVSTVSCFFMKSFKFVCNTGMFGALKVMKSEEERFVHLNLHLGLFLVEATTGLEKGKKKKGGKRKEKSKRERSVMIKLGRHGCCEV